MPTLREILDALEGWYDPRWAESWDAVGLVCGDPDESVERIVLAVDAVPATVAEAVEANAGLLITHHPLLLTGVHGVPADNPKGALVHRMIRGGVAHYVAHTNADVAAPGVSDALAELLGLLECVPLDARPKQLDKLVVFVPEADAERLIDALAAAGAGQLGDYDRCAWTSLGTGTFRPGPAATPTLGRANEIEIVAEKRVEMVLARAARAAVLDALHAVHPYEQPAFDLCAMAELPGPLGTGRIGRLTEALPLAAFAEQVAAVLPGTSWGVRVAGDPRRSVRMVGVCGGAGGSLIETARSAGADVYVTADLRHHSALEAVTERGPSGMALIDAAHWATEAPWLGQVATRLRDTFGTTVNVTVSTRVTDPWALHLPSPTNRAPR